MDKIKLCLGSYKLKHLGKPYKEVETLVWYVPSTEWNCFWVFLQDTRYSAKEAEYVTAHYLVKQESKFFTSMVVL